MASNSQQTSALVRPRVRVFMDFWNYELSMKQSDSSFKTDWRAFGPALVTEAAKLLGSSAGAEYQGMNVYASYDAARPGDDGLKKWATTVLDTFPGVHVTLFERQKKKSGPKCPACHTAVAKCGDVPVSVEIGG